MGTERSFAGKFLKNLERIDSAQVESFVASLMRENEFLANVLNAITEGVVVAEQGMRVVYMNEAAKALLGVRRDANGLRLLDLLKQEPLRTLACEFAESGTAVDQARVALDREEGPVEYAVTIKPIENAAQIQTHSVWILSDRTESARRAQEQQRMENMESLAALTAGVAHEVKNPLNSMGIHAQMILRAAREHRGGGCDDETAHRIEQSSAVILEEIDRLRRVVDDFIKAVRPVRLDLQRQRIDPLLEALGELFGPDCSARGIELTLQLDPEVPPFLFDREQLYQALLNVVKNAVEAIDKDEGRIVLRTRARTDRVLIEVEDNGIGIPEDERLRIFEPYRTTKFGGTGLGLMVVYRIIRAHRGAIRLHSKEGVGTVFAVMLPLDERLVRQLPAEEDEGLVDSQHLQEILGTRSQSGSEHS